MSGMQVVSLPDKQSPIVHRGLEAYPAGPMGSWISNIATQRKLYCKLPDRSELQSQSFLVAILAAALLGNASLQHQAIVQQIISSSSYALTPDYTMKMLHVEVCMSCQMQTHAAISHPGDLLPDVCLSSAIC